MVSGIYSSDGCVHHVQAENMWDRRNKLPKSQATSQYITLQMVEVTRINGGFIDQTELKTASTYTFDTLLISEGSN